MDARHHPFDVITGSMLGVVCAWAAYRQYFPSVGDFRAKGRAYPIRTWGRLRDENLSSGSLDRLPLKADAQGMGYENGRDASPEHGSGNLFRDELARRRRAGDDTSESANPAIPPPNYAVGNGNYYWYQSAQTRRFWLIAWDLDLAFDGTPWVNIQPAWTTQAACTCVAPPSMYATAPHST